MDSGPIMVDLVQISARGAKLWDRRVVRVVIETECGCRVEVAIPPEAIPEVKPESELKQDVREWLSELPSGSTFVADDCSMGALGVPTAHGHLRNFLKQLCDEGVLKRNGTNKGFIRV